MSSSQVPRAVEGVFAWRDASWRYRAGLSLVLCAMAMLLIGPFLPWFHTEMIMPQTGLSGVSGKPVRRSWNWIDLPFPGFERERRGHQDVYCGAGLPGLFIAGLASMDGRMSLDWTDARFVLDAGYYVTLAGYIVALAGNRLIALARRKIEGGHNVMR